MSGACRGLRGEDGFHGPLGGTCNPGGCSQAAGLELTLPPCSPQENGGELRSNSVSESPSSPAPLAVSPSSSETHSEVGLGMPGGGSGWKVGSGLSPHRGAVQGTRSGADTASHPQPHTQEGDKRHSASGSLLDLDIPLAVAKERAHQKRTSKRAPQMDWSKKNELFSNL